MAFKPHIGQCKLCPEGHHSFIVVKAGYCKLHNYHVKQQKKKNKPINNYSVITNKQRKPTGELKLFLQIYASRKGKCEITGHTIPFNISSFMHILSKGAYPSLRLNPNNIMMVVADIHYLYDNGSKDLLLTKYPSAKIIYDRKEELKQQYYQNHHNENN